MRSRGNPLVVVVREGVSHFHLRDISPHSRTGFSEVRAIRRNRPDRFG